MQISRACQVFVIAISICYIPSIASPVNLPYGPPLGDYQLAELPPVVYQRDDGSFSTLHHEAQYTGPYGPFLTHHYQGVSSTNAQLDREYLDAPQIQNQIFHDVQPIQISPGYHDSLRLSQVLSLPPSSWPLSARLEVGPNFSGPNSGWGPLEAAAQLWYPRYDQNEPNVITGIPTFHLPGSFSSHYARQEEGRQIERDSQPKSGHQQRKPRRVCKTRATLIKIKKLLRMHNQNQLFEQPWILRPRLKVTKDAQLSKMFAARCEEIYKNVGKITTGPGRKSMKHIPCGQLKVGFTLTKYGSFIRLRKQGNKFDDAARTISRLRKLLDLIWGYYGVLLEDLGETRVKGKNNELFMWLWKAFSNPDLGESVPVMGFTPPRETFDENDVGPIQRLIINYLTHPQPVNYEDSTAFSIIYMFEGRTLRQILEYSDENLFKFNFAKLVLLKEAHSKADRIKPTSSGKRGRPKKTDKTH